MKPAPFEYFAPETLAEALDLLRQRAGDARVLAGGEIHRGSTGSFEPQ